MSARARIAIVVGVWLGVWAGAAHAEPAPHGPAKAAKRADLPAKLDAPPPPAAAEPAAPPNAPATGAAADADGSEQTPPAAHSLPDGHEPKLNVKVEPPAGVRTGELVRLEIGADALLGDDVTIADQSFAPFEVHKKQVRVEQPQGQRQRFVFTLDLLAFDPGDKPIPAISLRVVTKDNFVGTVKTPAVPYRVRGRLDNEPNAQPKLETKPVAVLEDNWIPVYVFGALLAAGLVALATVLMSRYLRRRKAKAVPPPPPRPPWEIAVEALAELRRKKQSMIEAGQGSQFVEALSHVLRAYLGGRYHFDGLETTTDEMLAQLKAHEAGLGFTQEVAMFLGRCDLVKFAKVEPDADEVDLLYAKAQDLVQFSGPDESRGLTSPRPPPPSGPATTVPPIPHRSAPADPLASAAITTPGATGEARKSAPAVPAAPRKLPPVDRGPSA